MIYLFKDNSGYQRFPEPGPDSKPHLQVSGTAEQRILAGEPYRLTEDGNAIAFWTPQEVQAEQLTRAKTDKRQQIDSWRAEAERAGFTFNFPDNTSGLIQTRERDIANITGLVLAAQSNSGGVFYFRDGGDVTHPMTAADIIAMGNAVQAFITGNYGHAWGLKDAVQAATTVAAVEAISWE